VHAHIRQCLVARFGEEGKKVRILYGGSVKPSNAREILAAVLDPRIERKGLAASGKERADGRKRRLACCEPLRKFRPGAPNKHLRIV